MDKRLVERIAVAIGLIASVLLIVASYTVKMPQHFQIGPNEAFGFTFGWICVWLTVKENIWNWPIGILNCAFYVVVFWQSRLYADMGLQVIYIALAILGWYWWLRGGEQKTELKISRTPARQWIVLAVIAVVATIALREILLRVNGAAPFWDSLTTVMSLIAQYLITRKYLENWLIWITVDIIYVPLYISRGLYLTAILYLIFLALATRGFLEWRATHRSHLRDAAPAAG